MKLLRADVVSNYDALYVVAEVALLLSGTHPQILYLSLLIRVLR